MQSGQALHMALQSVSDEVDGMKSLELETPQTMQQDTDGHGAVQTEHSELLDGQVVTATEPRTKEESGSQAASSPIQNPHSKSPVGAPQTPSPPLMRDFAAQPDLDTYWTTQGNTAHSASSSLSPPPSSVSQPGNSEEGQPRVRLGTEVIDAAEMAEVAPDTPAVRRSTRRNAGQTSERYVDAAYETPTPRDRPSRRQQPKRKVGAATQSAQVLDIPDNMLEETLVPMTREEIEAWDGWAELESEPAFFNIILRNLGIEHVRVHELYTLGQIWAGEIPTPVHGLILLFQYVDDDWDAPADDDADAVWFANQTVDDACATVAMMNIIMNTPNLELGDRLREFKESTKDMSSPLRGHTLCSNRFIRTNHNAFVRRIDVLNSDMLVEDKVNESTTRPRKVAKKAAAKLSKKSNKRRKNSPESSFHYIAYVPIDGAVWELDGLRNHPAKICHYNNVDSWTASLEPLLQARFDDHQGLGFSLLAICGSPTRSLSARLAKVLHTAYTYSDSLEIDPAFLESLQAASPLPIPRHDEVLLAEHGLTKAAVYAAQVDPKDEARIYNVDASHPERRAFWEQLVAQARDLAAQMAAHRAQVAEDEAKVEARRMDYTPAIHAWMSALAEHGVLQELAGL